MGLKAGSSVPDGGWSFTAMVCGGSTTNTAGQLGFQERADVKLEAFDAHLRSCDLEVDACNGDWSRRQHGDDDHQYVGTRRRRVAGKVEKHPQTVAIKHRNRQKTTCGGTEEGLGLALQLG